MFELVWETIKEEFAEHPLSTGIAALTFSVWWAVIAVMVPSLALLLVVGLAVHWSILRLE